MRQGYGEFQARGAQILVIGPDSPNAFRQYWQDHDMPFVGLSDLGSRVAERYHQQVNLFKLGRMPALFIIDREGMIRYAHYGDSMSDIPANEQVLRVLDEINRAGDAGWETVIREGR